MGFIEMMLQILDFFYQIAFHNYGLAIILLTLTIKAAFWNMTNKQYESMEQMRKIQPKLKALQEKHRNDPQKMQQEILILYKEHGVNPFSGCLPMLIQLPVMILLFATLNSKEFLSKATNSSFLWIKNIAFAETLNFSAPGKLPKEILDYIQVNGLSGFNTIFHIGTVAIPILAILVALTTYWMQKTMDMDPEQRKMMALMPILLFFLSASLNAGVLLYWIVSNVATVFQQVYVKKHGLVKEEVAVIEIDRPKNKK